jgi:hypothetical protein
MSQAKNEGGRPHVDMFVGVTDFGILSLVTLNVSDKLSTLEEALALRQCLVLALADTLRVCSHLCTAHRLGPQCCHRKCAISKGSKGLR